MAPNDAELAAKPWLRSWFWLAPGEAPTLFYMVVIHLACLVGLILLPLPSWPVLAVAVGLFLIGGMGTTVAYHRVLTHRGADLHPLILQPMVFFTMFNGSGSPRSWVANHRHHHAFSDTDQDISSPHHGGFWWAHLRWLWQAPRVDQGRFARDLTGGIWSFWERVHIPVLAVSVLGGLALAPWIGWEAALASALWLGPIRLVFALHVQCTINSICHLGPMSGAHGSGKNVWWLAPFHAFQGENWHENHHERPADPRLGRKPLQIDLGWWFLRGCCLVGLGRIRRGQPTSATDPS